MLPNAAASFIVEEMKERLAAGHTVRISFGGSSMMPLIDGRKDLALFGPVGDAVCVGEIYMFVYEGCSVVHRLLRIEGDTLVFRGDNAYREEKVARADVVAHLVALEHADGTIERCDTEKWHRRSRRVLRIRSVKDFGIKVLSRHRRKWLRWLYFVLLVVLMWAPVGVLGIPLNNFVFGIRMDHLLHASLFVPISFFLMDFRFLERGGRIKANKRVLLFGISVALVMETVQLLLPYRGFDINDLVANILGVALGWIIIRFLKK